MRLLITQYASVLASSREHLKIQSLNLLKLSCTNSPDLVPASLSRADRLVSQFLPCMLQIQSKDWDSLADRVTLTCHRSLDKTIAPFSLMWQVPSPVEIELLPTEAALWRSITPPRHFYGSPRGQRENKAVHLETLRPGNCLSGIELRAWLLLQRDTKKMQFCNVLFDPTNLRLAQASRSR